jgi:hemoglobin
MIANAELSEERLAELIERFYVKVRRDALIGPVFNSAIRDWPRHLEKLSRFWSSVMLTSGRYKGNPLAEHLKHADAITPEMFERWLALWRETTAEIFSASVASELQVKAVRIAESLQFGLKFRHGWTQSA